MDKQNAEEGKKHKSCFGKYYDENNNPCENADYCSYCVECQKSDPNY